MLCATDWNKQLPKMPGPEQCMKATVLWHNKLQERWLTWIVASLIQKGNWDILERNRFDWLPMLRVQTNQKSIHQKDRTCFLQEGSHTVRELEWWRHQVPQIFCTAKPVTHRQAHCHIGKTEYQHKVSRERHMRRCDCSKGEFTKQNQLHRCQESAQFLLMSNSIKSCCKFAGFKFKFQVA